MGEKFHKSSIFALMDISRSRKRERVFASDFYRRFERRVPSPNISFGRTRAYLKRLFPVRFPGRAEGASGGNNNNEGIACEK